MNRKSIRQTILLLVLLGVGAGAYLAREQGVAGLGGAVDFVKELIGGESDSPSRVAAPAPPASPSRTPEPAQPEPAARAREPAGPAIPSQPAQGEIRKVAFAVDAAVIENGVLTLRQKRQPLEVKIFLPANPWQAPAGRSFQVLAPRERTAETPLVRIRVDGAPRRDYSEKYTLWLRFGREQDGKLPGKIYLALPDGHGSRVAGTFTADIRGFRFIDGEPDLSIDSVDTLQYLALREILEDDPDKPLNDLLFRDGGVVPAPAGGAPDGFLEVVYRVGNADLVQQRFRFAKKEGRWRVAEALPPEPAKGAAEIR